MARVIGVINRKGGVGKTTIAVNLAAGLARSGKRVLLVDLDAQNSASEYILGKDFEKRIFSDPAGRNLAAALLSYLKSGTTDHLQQSILKTSDEMPLFSGQFPTLHLLASHEDLSLVEKRLVSQKNGHAILASALGGIEQDYDFIVLDAPPSFSRIFENAIYYSTDILIPIIPDWMSTAGIQRMLLYFHEQSSMFADRVTNIRAIIINLHDRKNLVYSKHTRDLLAELKKWKQRPEYSKLLSDTEVWIGPQRLASVIKAAETRSSLWEYRDDEPARKALSGMVARILKQW